MTRLRALPESAISLPSATAPTRKRIPMTTPFPRLSIVLVALLALAGCASPTASAASDPCTTRKAVNIGLVTGAVANEQTPTLSPELIDLLKRASATNGSVTIAVPSGRPVSMGTGSLGSTAHDASVCTSQQESAVNGVVEYADTLKATSKQVDFLGALDLAARGAGAGSLGVAVVGSGIQTVDPLDFSVTDGLLYAAPAQVAHDLAARGLLPASLKGMTVYWSNLGLVGGDQARLTPPAASNLEAVWRAVIERAGGRLVVLKDATPGPTVSRLPAVNVVLVRPEKTKQDWSQPLVLHESDLKFAKGSSEFASPNLAEATLAALAPTIIASGRVVTFTGTASRDGAKDNAADKALSLSRAAHVIRQLHEDGVPSDRLVPDGVGFDWCGWKTETDATGAYSSTLAAANRSVVLTTPGVALCAT